MFPTTLHEYIEIMRRRAGLSVRDLAGRMDWPPGTVASYLHRLRAGRVPRRRELEEFAAGLSDPRSPLAAKVVIMRYLHAIAGIEPTPEELVDFVEFNFPRTPADPSPSFCYDTRAFVRGVSPMVARRGEIFGGPSETGNTTRMHSWALAAPDGTPPEKAAVPALCRRAPALFRLDADAVLDAWDDLTFRPVHMLELWANPDYAAGLLFDSDADGNISAEGVAAIAHDVRLLEILHPKFRRAPWYGSVDRRLSRFEGYREGLRRAALHGDEPESSPPLYLSTDFTDTTQGLMISSAATVLLDPRFAMHQVLPADQAVWRSWHARD